MTKQYAGKKTEVEDFNYLTGITSQSGLRKPKHLADFIWPHVVIYNGSLK